MANTRYSITERHAKRTNHLQKVCKYLSDKVKMIKYTDIDTMQQIYTVRNTAVCVVPKSGCTFLKQIIYHLNDPFQLMLSEKLEDVTLDIGLQYIERLQEAVFNLTRFEIHYNLDFKPVTITGHLFRKGDFQRVIVARNPYSRLYSAYIDKVYVPVLKEIFEAKYLEKIKHGEELNISKACKEYVSFEDFLEIILLQMKQRTGNPHWLPASVLCNACKVKPDIVIKQETYYEDIDFFLSQTGISQTEWENIDAAIAKKGIQSDSAVRGLIQTMYLKGLHSEIKCFSQIQIAQRVWDALQIQGQVYQYSNFPLAELRRFQSLSAFDVANVFLSEMKKLPITSEESRHQRQMSLAKAYRHIKLETIKRIQAMFYYDFMIFDYDIDPPK